MRSGGYWIEWPEGETEPDHYWLSTLAASRHLSFECLVDLTKLRWRIERDYLELKQEVGARPLRRPRMARLSPSRRVFALRPTRFLVSEKVRGDDSPSGPAPHLAQFAICPSRRLPTQRICRCGSQRHMPNSIATLRIRSFATHPGSPTATMPLLRTAAVSGAGPPD